MPSMSSTDSKFIVVFATTRAFIQGEKSVQGIPHEIINTPRELYEQCGMCLCFSENQRTAVEAILPPHREDLIFLDAPKEL